MKILCITNYKKKIESFEMRDLRIFLCNMHDCHSFSFEFHISHLQFMDDTLIFFVCFRTGFRSTKGGRLIRLVRRDMCTDQTLFPLEIEPGIPQIYILGRSSLPLGSKQLG
jgi:hypothetical protein